MTDFYIVTVVNDPKHMSTLIRVCRFRRIFATPFIRLAATLA